MEIQIVEFFKSWSCKFCDLFFSVTNILGDDLFFYLVFFALYWVYDKRFAFKYAFVYLLSCGINIGLKSLVKRPRPFGAIESGYSFPSGHSQSFATVGAGLLYESKKQQFPKKKWQRVELMCEFVIFGALVAIGRMYWGVHYLTDVVAGLLLGTVIACSAMYILDMVIGKIKVNLDKILLYLVPAVVAVYIVVACTNIIDDPENLAKIYRIVGIYLSVVVGYFVDKKWIKYSEKDTQKNSLYKIIAGSAVLMMIYALFIQKMKVNALTPLYYFIVGIIATVVLPYIFKTIKNEPEQGKE